MEAVTGPRLLAALTGITGHWLLGWHRCRAGGGCTALGQTAAATYGLAAVPKLLQLSGDCWHEHPGR
jgi:hypothetical protein